MESRSLANGERHSTFIPHLPLEPSRIACLCLTRFLPFCLGIARYTFDNIKTDEPHPLEYDPSVFDLSVLPLGLEEHITIVLHISVNIKFLHEVSGILHHPLTLTLFVLLSVELNRTHLLVYNLEHINASIALNRL